MHTSITGGDVWCKKQSVPVLPQSVTEEKDEEKNQKILCEKNLL